jgi:hypothetical protein
MKLNNGTADYIRETFLTRADVVDGICRWLNSGNIPFEDMLEDFLMLGLISVECCRNSVDLREEESAAKIAEYVNYRKENGYSAEEMFEMRAAFGPDTEVVNVITGERISL